MARAIEYNYAHKAARRRLLASHPLCHWCGKQPATVADHDPPVSSMPKGQWKGTLRASCADCSARQGYLLGRAGGAQARRKRGEPPPSRPW